MSKEKNKKIHQLSLSEYQALKEKKDKTYLETGMPWPVQLFCFFPLWVLAFVLCFGIFCLPHLAKHPDNSQALPEKE